MARLRDAVPGDAEAIGALTVRAWRAAFRGAVDDAVLDAQDSASRVAYFAGCLPSAAPEVTLVAEHDAVVVGFVHAGPSRDDDGAGIGEIRGLYVEPGFQGRGIGRALVEAAVAALRACGVSEATLWTLRDVAATRRFYERLGWAADGAEQTGWAAGHPLHQVRYRRNL